jgi:putative ABC transport system ATP-binding protein
LHKKVVIIGITLTLASFVILMAFDSQLSFLILGAPQSGQLFSSSEGALPSFSEGIPEDFAERLAERGTVLGVGSTGGQVFSATAYARLSAYLVGLTSIIITSLGMLLEPKRRPKSDGDEDKHKPSEEQVVDTKSLATAPEEKHQPSPELSDDRGQKSRNAIIKLESVVKTYGGDGVMTPALNGLSLEISKGEFVAIVGPSGSGKSTLLNMIGALDKPTAGNIFIDGIDVSKLNDRELAVLRNRKIGFIFQSFNLIPRMTALANVEFPLASRNVPPHERRQMAQKALQLVGLSNKTTRTPSKLSGGEMQRVAVARALVTEPAILLADEPTGNLDTKNTNKITEMLRNLNEKTGRTIVMITHNMEVASATERVIYLRDGRVEREEFPNVRGGCMAA